MTAGIGDGDRGMRCFEVGASGEGLLLEVVHADGDGRRDDLADDVEVGTGLVDAEQHLELVAGLLCGDDGVGLVGLELGELEVEALEVELGDVACLVAVVADVDLVFEVGKVVVGELLRGFGDDEVGEGLADGEDGLLARSGDSCGVGLRGGGAGAVEPPAALLAALEEAAYAGGVVVGVVRILAER